MSWITDAFTDSVDKLWRATRDGLTLSCTVHPDAADGEFYVEEDDRPLEQAGMTRSFN